VETVAGVSQLSVFGAQRESQFNNLPFYMYIFTLQFLYYLDCKKATLISVADDISILAYENTLPSPCYYMLTIILQLRRWSKSGRGTRFPHLVHQLRLESRRSLRECLLSVPTMDSSSYPVGLRETTYFHSKETSLHPHTGHHESPSLAVRSSPRCCYLGTLLCCP
jgi:hypothetical protein